MGIEQRPISTETEAQSVTGEFLTKTLVDFRLKGPVLFLISGGSALGVLDFIDASAYCTGVTVSMGDERVTRDKKYNNFLQFKNTEAYIRMKVAHAEVIETIPEPSESLLEFAERYNRKIAEWFDRNLGEKKRGHVLALLGIGEDGHTSGIMTDLPKSVRNRLTAAEHYVVGYQTDHGGAYPRRATTSMWFLRSRIDAAVIYAWGESKSGAMQKVLAPKGSLRETPARIFGEVEYPVILFTSSIKKT